MWPSPKPKFKPAVWRFAAAKSALDQAGEFVPVEQAERRNLIMVNPIEGNIYATSRNIVAAYQMVKAGETRALAPPYRGGAAPGGAGEARHLHRGRRRPRRHGAGRRGADAVLVLARPRQRERRDQLLDRLPRRAVRAAFGSDVLRAQSGGLRDHHQRPVRRRIRIPSRDALGAGQPTPRTVEIAKGVLPTIGLHLMRLPSGTRREVAEDHRQPSLFGDQRQGARHDRGRIE